MARGSPPGSNVIAFRSSARPDAAKPCHGSPGVVVQFGPPRALVSSNDESELSALPAWVCASCPLSDACPFLEPCDRLARALRQQNQRGRC